MHVTTVRDDTESWAIIDTIFYKLFFSVIDRNVFEITEKKFVISVRMSANLG